MPNHVTNIIRISCDDKKRKDEIMLSLLDSCGTFNFEQIIQMPKILIGTSSPNNTNAEECIKATGFESWFEWSRANWGTKWNAYSNALSYNPVGFKIWHRTVKGGFFGENSKERGYPTRINKKRFKRSIMENGVQESIHFQTAWCIPEPIYVTLSQKFPDAIFDIEFADEDTGSNCGNFSLQNGDMVKSDIAPSYRDQTPEEKIKWASYAFKLNNPNTDPRSYGYDENWEYSEKVEEEYDKEQKMKKEKETKIYI